MTFRTLTTCLMTLVVIAGCDQFSGKHEIVRAGNQTFLLNKSTGDTKLIDSTSLVAVKAPDSSAADDPYKKKAKSWPDQSINELQGVRFKLRTKYRDGAMLWTIEAGPFPGALERQYKSTALDSTRQPTILFELYDDDGFKTGQAIEVKVRFGLRAVNEKDEVISLSWSGTQALSIESYRSAASISIRWYGFSKE